MSIITDVLEPINDQIISDLKNAESYRKAGNNGDALTLERRVNTLRALRTIIEDALTSLLP